MDIQYNAEAKRFETQTDHGLARLDVIHSPSLLTLSHTEVPVGAEGQGIASALAKAAFDHARAEGLRVMPLCPFTAAYVRRHPEERDIVMPGFIL